VFLTTMRVRRLRARTRREVEQLRGLELSRDCVEVLCHGQQRAFVDDNGNVVWQHPDLTPVAAQHFAQLVGLAVDLMGWTQSAGLRAAAEAA
jgi:hypothetical protein